jgi:arsenate reductase (thioredoxin)
VSSVGSFRDPDRKVRINTSAGEYDFMCDESEGTMYAAILALMFLLQQTDRDPAVVFVCEHGAAKSVIATAYFNKLAAERGLPYRATFRGTSPQDELSVRAVAGLKADGVAVPSGKPAAISDDDVAGATHIFAIGCTLPDKARRSGKSADWSDVPDDQGYGPMRDAIVRHVQHLLDELAGVSAGRRRGSR